jgi:hypothetical protein
LALKQSDTIVQWITTMLRADYVLLWLWQIFNGKTDHDKTEILLNPIKGYVGVIFCNWQMKDEPAKLLGIEIGAQTKSCAIDQYN